MRERKIHWRIEANLKEEPDPTILLCARRRMGRQMRGHANAIPIRVVVVNWDAYYVPRGRRRQGMLRCERRRDTANFTTSCHARLPQTLHELVFWRLVLLQLSTVQIPAVKIARRHEGGSTVPGTRWCS